VARALFLCDGASKPSEWRDQAWDVEGVIRHHGPRADLNLRVENLSHRVLGAIDARASDLVRIAAYVYGADQSVRRGGPKDVYGADWRRTMALSIPVVDPDFWSQREIRDVLQDALNFVSDDDWEFHFSPGAPEAGQLVLNVDKAELLSRPDSVVLFSGGTDSLCATIERAAASLGRPLLVSHRPTPPVDSRQKTLLAGLRRCLAAWPFPQIGIWVHRRGSDAVETSQRSRSFLFASLGTAVAGALNVRDVILADNGVVSLNIPFNAQLVGALATRSTHPKFLWLFNRFIQTVFDDPPQLSNPLANRTRAEAFQILRANHAEALLQETVSCSHARGRPSVQPHCGICSQCIDRRFASLSASLEEHDLAECYGLDIFRDQLPPGNGRTLAVSFVRFATQICENDETALFIRFPQLGDCILPADPEPERTAHELVALLKRHAAGVLGVMESLAALHTADLASGRLPPNSLLASVASGRTPVEVSEPPDDEDEDFRHSPDFTTVVSKGTPYSLTPQQAQIVKLLNQAYENKAPELSQAYILAELKLPGTQLRDTFKKSEAWGRLVVRGRRRSTYRLNR
jgi:7-cyano-7-deazaguanine synthase in queuosine biosynthesis